MQKSMHTNLTPSVLSPSHAEKTKDLCIERMSSSSSSSSSSASSSSSHPNLQLNCSFLAHPVTPYSSTTTTANVTPEPFSVVRTAVTVSPLFTGAASTTTGSIGATHLAGDGGGGGGAVAGSGAAAVCSVGGDEVSVSTPMSFFSSLHLQPPIVGVQPLLSLPCTGAPSDHSASPGLQDHDENNEDFPWTVLNQLRPFTLMNKTRQMTPDMRSAWDAIQRLFQTPSQACAATSGQTLSSPISCTTCSGGPFKINENLYLGDIFQAKDRASIHHLRITHIVNFATATNTGRNYYISNDRLCPYVQDYYSVRADDTPTYPLLDAHIVDIFDYYTTVLKQDPNARFLFHCIAGVNRSATCAVACLMMQERIDIVQAVRRVRNARGFILSNDNFVRQLIALADMLGLLRQNTEIQE